LQWPVVAQGRGAAPVEEKTEFSVVLTDVGAKQDQRHQSGPRSHQPRAEWKPRIWLMARPNRLKKASNKDEAATIKKKFEAPAGAKVEITVTTLPLGRLQRRAAAPQRKAICITHVFRPRHSNLFQRPSGTAGGSCLGHSGQPCPPTPHCPPAITRTGMGEDNAKR